MVSPQKTLDRESQIKVVEDHNVLKQVIDDLHIIGCLWASTVDLEDDAELDSLIRDQPQHDDFTVIRSKSHKRRMRQRTPKINVSHSRAGSKQSSS